MKRTLMLSCLLVCFCSQASNKISEKHQSADLGCYDCHQKGDKFSMADDSVCTDCHGTRKEIAETTEKNRGIRDISVLPNPHNSVHFGQDLNCTACHYEHETPEIYCNKCHNFKFQKFR